MKSNNKLSSISLAGRLYIDNCRSFAGTLGGLAAMALLTVIFATLRYIDSPEYMNRLRHIESVQRYNYTFMDSSRPPTPTVDGSHFLDHLRIWREKALTHSEFPIVWPGSSSSSGTSAGPPSELFYCSANKIYSISVQSKKEVVIAGAGTRYMHSARLVILPHCH